MKKVLLIVSAVCFISVISLTSDLKSKEIGEACVNDAECGFQLRCNDRVCIRKKEFDFGSSGETGKPCNIDAECINSGKCVSNNFGKKYCSGN